MSKRLIAALVVLAASLTAGFSVRAAATPDLKPRVLEYWKAWQSGPDAAAPLYAKNPDLSSTRDDWRVGELAS